MNTFVKPLPRSLLLLAGLMAAAPAPAYVVNINSGARAVYLRVGDGTMTGGNGTYNGGATPGDNATVNLVSVTVPAASVGNGTAQAMQANGRLTSDWDGYAFCNANQVYIGGFFRRTGGGTDNATLTVVAPANLTNGARTIPMSQISWTSSGNGDTGGQPIPAGTFTGGSQLLANNFQNNTWRESCMSFSYANQTLVAAGNYDATVTYTLTAP
jgi:hypothetical protein